MRKRQYLYICSNPSMPGLLKIGKTTKHPHQRIGELHTTGVPTPFEFEFSCVVADCSSSERLAHRALASFRVSLDREFFRISVKAALKKILPVIGAYHQPKCREKGILPSNGPSKSSLASPTSSKETVQNNPVSCRSVLPPSAWPFPTSNSAFEDDKRKRDRRKEESTRASKDLDKSRRKISTSTKDGVQNKTVEVKSVIAPAAWPFPTSKRP